MMASESEISVSGSGLKLEAVQSPPRPETEDPPPLKQKDQMFPSPGHQNSILSLTLDEIQSKSGKSFGSMNMDEFLASIWSVEDAGPPSSSLSLLNDPANNNNNNKAFAVPGPGPLLRQASFSIPTPLCNKTVDEVWFEIHGDRASQPLSAPGHNPNNSMAPRRQQTFGEMTLEDFLVRVGVVHEPIMHSQPKSALASALIKPPPGFVDSALSLDSSHGMRNLAGFGIISISHRPENNLSHNGFMTNYPTNVFNEQSHGFTEAFGSKGKRIIDGPPEMVVERRQRRMIKNRESAARSRARRQAYTVELEVELNQLKEENESLKKIVAETEEKRRKEVMKRKQSIRAAKAAEQLRAMRRTVSMAW